MPRPLARLLPWLAVAGIVLAAWRLWPDGGASAPRLLDPAVLAAALPAVASDDGFATPADTDGDWTPELPRDLGPHPAYRTELWDLTADLRGADGKRFGLRLTLVRLGLRPPAEQAGDAPGDGARASPGRASGLAAEALLVGRLALVPEAGEPLFAERASRVAAGLAGANADPPEVWLEDWRLAPAAMDAAGEGRVGRVVAAADGTRLTLNLIAEKAAVTPAAELLVGGGPAGGADPDAGPGFRWLAAPRLGVSGRLVRPEGESAVSGSGWLDHVWGAAAGAGAGLAGTRGQLALNRFLLQLDDDSELLCIHLRRRAGGGIPVPTCLAIAADGGTRVLRRREVTLAPLDTTWRSADRAAAYPIAWRLAAPALELALDLRALHPDQELVLGERLWSGAVAVSGERAGQRIGGGGRMDLSGYAAAPDG